MHLVIAWVLLNISLYCGKRFCIYFVDFVAISLVSQIVMMAGWFDRLDVSVCRLGSDILRDVEFPVINCFLVCWCL